MKLKTKDKDDERNSNQQPLTTKEATNNSFLLEEKAKHVNKECKQSEFISEKRIKFFYYKNISQDLK